MNTYMLENLEEELSLCQARLHYIYMKQMAALLNPVMTYDEWLLAIDKAIQKCKDNG